MSRANSFGTRTQIHVGSSTYDIYDLTALERAGFPRVARLPYSLKILLENLLRHEDGASVKAGDIEALAKWDPAADVEKEIAFTPARVLLQDFTACRPSSIWRRCATRWRAWAATRTASIRCSRWNSSSITRCRSTTSARADAFQLNAELEYARNQERYTFLRWGQNAFAQLPRRAARDGHRAPGEPRVPRARRLRRRQRRRGVGVPGHARRHRLAHDDGERPGRGRLGRRRHRGRGGDARPADLDADSRRCSASGSSGRCRPARRRPTSC